MKIKWVFYQAIKKQNTDVEIAITRKSKTVDEN